MQVRDMRCSELRFAALIAVVLLVSGQLCLVQDSASAASIPESKITALQKALAAVNKATSSSRKRRACKSVIRSGEALLKPSPDAPNRYQVLAIIFQTQKRLLGLENTARNREALFSTCSTIAKAPDEHAELRLEADMLLSERDLSAKKADVKERAKALEEMIQRYRGTPGEEKSLMIAARIAPKLEAFDLKKAIIRTLSERFQGDLDVIQFRRKNLNDALLDVEFRGTFTRSDGTTLSFPIDRMGHTSLMYFWSKETPEIEQRLAEVKAIQTRFPGQFQVFGFNLDKLPDAGEKNLRALGLDWTAMHLPGGRKTPTFRAYVQDDPGAVLVNAQGHALLTGGMLYKGKIPLIPKGGIDKTKRSLGGGAAPRLEHCIDSDRYLAQLQSLSIGDFLVGSLKWKPSADSVPKEKLDVIQSCFTVPPMRYRLARQEAVVNYMKVDGLCREATAKHPKATDLWRVHNRRIIALLGMWNFAAESKHLETAVAVSKAVLASNPPAQAWIVPQFCLAKDALRKGDEKPGAVLKTFIDATGGDAASGTALAAAALLAQDANQRDLFSSLRQKLLNEHADEPMLWPVTTFLRDRHHRYRFFRATHGRFGFSRAERHAVGRNVAALDEPADSALNMEAVLRTLDGGKLRLPQDTAGKLTFVAFLDLPADEEIAKSQNYIVQKMNSLADSDVAKSIKVIVAFLSNETDRIAALVKKNEWKCLVAIVPDGIKNPMVLRYGILSADRMPNVFLLRGDGSISWSISGITYPIQGSSLAARIVNAIDANITVCQMEAAKSALDKGEFQTAIRLFSEALAPKNKKGDWWGTFRFHGRAQAHAALKQWEAALADIDEAIDRHTVFGWGLPHRCELVAKLQLTRANFLDQLGRVDRAKEEREKAAAPTHPHKKSPFGLYGEGLEKFRLNPHQ
jgi:tetratricopeptide (TPR) repeat protein